MTISPEEATQNIDEKTLPEYNILCLRYWNVRESLPWRLWKIAESSFVGSSFVVSYQILIGKSGFQRSNLVQVTNLGFSYACQKRSMFYGRSIDCPRESSARRENDRNCWIGSTGESHIFSTLSKYFQSTGVFRRKMMSCKSNCRDK